jgi:hypothetical protein
MTRNQPALERVAPLAAGILLALPTCLTHFPPMSDLPIHEGAVGVLRHLGDPDYFPPELYQLNLGHPNQLFYLVAWALSYVTGTRWAVKLVVALTQIAILVTGARLSDYLGRSRWGAVLLAPLALGYTYYWGLVTNLTGFAALFGTLPVIDRATTAPSRSGAAKVLAAFTLLYFAHETVLWIAMGYVALVALSRLRGPATETLLRVGPAVVAVISLVAYHVVANRSFTEVQRKVASAFTPLPERVVNVPNDLFGSYDPPVRLALFVLALLAAGALARARWQADEPRPTPPRALDLLHHYRFEVSAAFFVVGFFAAPSKWNSATLLYSRFAGPAWALFAIGAAPRGAIARASMLLTGAVPIAITLVAWPQFADSDASYRDLDALIAEIPRGSAVAACRIDEAPFRMRAYNVNPGPARALADRGGRMSMSLVTSPIAPARIRPEYRWDEFDVRNAGNDPTALFPASDLDRFPWVLAQSRAAYLRSAMVAGFRPDAELVDARGEWLLFHSTHPPLPLTAPDSPPRAGRESLLQRVTRILIERELQNGQAEP